MKHILFFLLLWVLMPGLSSAETAFLPGLYRVSGVAADDTLNIRAAPRADANRLGELSPEESGIEVTGLDTSGRWGRIGLGEGDGWVAMRYMTELPFPQGDIPDGLTCLGTEPFWTLGFAGAAATYSDPDGAWPDGTAAAAATRVPPGRQTYGFLATFPEARLSGTVEASACSDGMSDRTFGWRIVLLIDAVGTTRLEQGCCTLARR
jgi:uncharacterized membrane protein